MVQTANLANITSDTTLSVLNDFYLVNAVGGNLTITLPPITTNGVDYRLNRIDTSLNSVTVSATGANMIIQNLGVTGTTGDGLTGNYSLWPQINAEFTSCNNNWYITNSSSTIYKAPIFSTAFYSGSNRYITCQCPVTPTRTMLCQFPYDGIKYGSRMTEIELALSGNNPFAACTGTIDLRVSGTPNTLVSQSFFFQQNFTTFRLIKITNIPTLSPNSYSLEIGFTGVSTVASQNIFLYSVVVR